LASTSEVYGKNTNVPFKETDDRILGSTHISRWSYSCAKAVDEFLALAYSKEKGLPVIIVRFFNIIGHKQSSRYGMVVPRFIKQALKNEPLTIYGDGAQRRCFTDVNDAVTAIINLMEIPEALGEIFNIGNSEEISIKDLAMKIKKLTNSNSELKFIAFEEVYGKDFEDMLRRVPDISKIRETVNYEPQVELDTTLKKIIKHYESLQ